MLDSSYKIYDWLWIEQHFLNDRLHGNSEFWDFSPKPSKFLKLLFRKFASRITWVSIEWIFLKLSEEIFVPSTIIKVTLNRGTIVLKYLWSKCGSIIYSCWQNCCKRRICSNWNLQLITAEIVLKARNNVQSTCLAT